MVVNIRRNRMLRTPLHKPFKVEGQSLLEILDSIQVGGIQLPNLQREWRWKDSLIKSLLGSYAQGHPVGSVIFLETGGDVGFGIRPVEGTGSTAEDNSSPSRLILDGQQRLTASYQACKSSNPVKINSGKNPKHRLYFFDMTIAADGSKPVESSIFSIETDEAGVPLRKKDTVFIDADYQFENCIYPVNQIFSYEDWRALANLYWDEGANFKKEFRGVRKSVIDDFAKAIVPAFMSCEIAVTTISKKVPAIAVCEIYENLNSKGLDLDAFELQIARYAAQNYNLRKDWFGDDDGNVGYLKRLEVDTEGLLAFITPKQFLHAVLTLSNMTRKEANISEALYLPLARYSEYHADAFEGFARASRFLKFQSVYRESDLPPRIVVTGLAVILSRIRARGRREDEQEISAKLRRWVWCCTYTGEHAKSGDKGVATDLPALEAWLLDGGPAPKSVSHMAIVVSSLEQATTGNVEKALGPSIMRRGALDFGTSEKVERHMYIDEEYDMHHIFPSKWCEGQNIDPDIVNSVVNKTPISKNTNIILSGSAPSEYIEKIKAKWRVSDEVVDAALRSHGINPTHLRNDDFRSFFAERSLFVKRLVEEDTGNEVFSRSDAFDLVNAA